MRHFFLPRPAMLDSYTTLVLTALVSLLLPLLVWWATRDLASRAVVWWCIGSALLGVGLILMGLRPHLPVWLSFHIGNTCLMASKILQIQSFRMTLGRPGDTVYVLVAVLVAFLFYSVLFHQFSPAMRGVGVRVALGLLSLYQGLLALMLYQRIRSPNPAAMGVSYGVLGAMFLGQIMLQIGVTNQPNPFSGSWDASTLALVVLLTTTVNHFCYTGILLEMSNQDQLRNAQDRAIAEETAQLEAQLQHIDRQERMVLISGSLAHELNQPLTAALTHSQLALRQLETQRSTPEQLHTLYEKTENNLKRASAILTRIRQFNQTQQQPLQHVDVRECIAQSITLLESEWHMHQVQVELHLGTTPLCCFVDPLGLSQILVNLLRNAIQAVEHAPRKRVQVCSVTDGQDIQIVVRDSGPGVDSAILMHLGEPFNSKNPQGLGLGWTISHTIAKQHNGRLTLRNLPEGGAEAVLYIPEVP
jgi:signal transduction histidine kinase